MAVDGEIVWAEGFRWADLENQTSVTPATLFRIGGVSKTLTAAAVGLLSDRDRLALDAPVQRYVPSFPEKKWPISTRQLMAHTAGIRPHRGEGGIFQGAGCAEDAERLAIFAGHLPSAVTSGATSLLDGSADLLIEVLQKPRGPAELRRGRSDRDS